MVTGVLVLTVLVVTLKVDSVVPFAKLVDPGVVATAELSDKLANMSELPVIAGALMEILPCDEVPPLTAGGFISRAVITGLGRIVTDAVFVCS